MQQPTALAEVSWNDSYNAVEAARLPPIRASSDEQI
jgi:hypothetical protein